MVGRRPRSCGCVGLVVLLAAVLLLGVPSLRLVAAPPERAKVSALAPAQITDFGGWYPLPTTGPAPVPRTSGQMAFDSALGAVVLFGGCAAGVGRSGCATFLNDTWTFSGEHWTQVDSSVAPPARDAGMLADDPAAGALILFGGSAAGGLLGDTWEYRGGQWTELHPPHAPPPRCDAALAFDSIDAALVLVGGLVANATAGDGTSWTYSDGDWASVGAAGPAPPGWISPYLAPDPATGQLVLYGGLTSVGAAPALGQTWLFADGGWTNETAALSVTPAPRVGALYGFDPFTSEPVLFGGGTTTAADSDLWELQGRSNWTEQWGGGDPPAAFLRTQSTWDPTDGFTIEFGNESPVATLASPGAASNLTWGLLSLLNVAESSLGGTIPAAVGAPVEITATVVGGLPPYHLHWDLGDGDQLVGDNLTHVYSRTGEFQVTLNVTDNAGEALSQVLGVVDVTTAPVPAAGPSPTWVPYGLVAAEAGAVATVVVAVLWLRRRRDPG